MCPGLDRTQYLPVLVATSGEVARKTDVLAPVRGLIWNGRMARKPKPPCPMVSPSMPKRLRTQPGWAVLAVTSGAGHAGRASSRVKSTLASLARQ